VALEVHLNLSEDAFEALQRLAEEHHITKTEVLHHAISLQSFFDQELKNGGRVLIENGAGFRQVVLWS
jgi:predicted transcriptional regulator